MSTPVTPQNHCPISPVNSCIFLFLMILLIPISAQAQKHPCHQAGKELQASFDTMSSRGGIWGFMEQSQTLKEMSMIGLQLDGKLQRMVVIFQTMCVEGKKIPSKDLFVEIRDLLGDARMVFNLSPAKTSVDIIMEKLNGLNKKLDALLEKIG